MKNPEICRYCGGVIRLVPAEKIYGEKAAKRLGLTGERIYQCQNCNARVGCHKGTDRPLGNVANEALRLKRIGTHHIFDTYRKSQQMTRTNAYKWLSQQMLQLLLATAGRSPARCFPDSLWFQNFVRRVD